MINCSNWQLCDLRTYKMRPNYTWIRIFALIFTHEFIHKKIYQIQYGSDQRNLVKVGLIMRLEKCFSLNVANKGPIEIWQRQSTSWFPFVLKDMLHEVMSYLIAVITNENIHLTIIGLLFCHLLMGHLSIRDRCLCL